MSGSRLSAREELVLGAIIDLYIKTGEPVASQAVARVLGEREGLSAATIRNVMAALGEAGLLEQPHASAGRTPTAAAFRAYVERFTEPGAGGVRVRVVRFGQVGMAAAHDSERSNQRQPSWREPPEPAWRNTIDENFSGVRNTTEFLERTSHVLSLLSSGLGVALAGTPVRLVLEHVHFSRLAAGRVLAVVVTSGGSVQDRVLGLDRDISMVELETAACYLNENFRGWLVESIRVEIARRMDEERAAYHNLLEGVEELCRKGALASVAATPTVFVEGMANLIGTEQDRERLKEMLAALETKQRLVELLGAYVDSREREVRVVVGLDEASPAMQDLVLIAAPARLGAESEGTVAVIAPTRIQYQQMIQAVRYVAGLPEKIMN